jgi:hypothetical protein
MGAEIASARADRGERDSEVSESIACSSEVWVWRTRAINRVVNDHVIGGRRVLA